MFKSYLKAGFRNLFHNKSYAMINIIGLAVAIACCITAYVNYSFTASFDTFHPNSDQLYLVNSYKEANQQRQDWTLSPMPLPEAMRKDIPGIKYQTRIWVSGAVMKVGEKVFNERIQFVDPDFEKMFHFPPISGERNVLTDKSAVIISRGMAEKYFGSVNPIGQQISLSPDGLAYQEFFVKAVIENTPLNSSISGNLFMAFDNMKPFRNVDPAAWDGRWSRSLIIQVGENASAAEIEGKLSTFVPVSNQANENWQIAGFYLMPFTELVNHSSNLRGEPFRNPMPVVSIIAPSMIAVLILLLACFNFVNTAIASAARRLKEIGVRKVMGGHRSQLILQFIGENLILCAIALGIGVFLSVYLFVPYYNSLWQTVDLSVDFSQYQDLFLLFSVLLAFTGILAGAYPAFYISKFNPITIFRGKQKFGGTNRLIRILLTFQFALSIVCIIGGFIMSRNAEFIQDFDLGFEKEQMIAVGISDGDQFQMMRSAIQNHPDIINIAGSRSQIGMSWSLQNVKVLEKETEVRTFDIGENFFETADLKLIDGRVFDKDLQSDQQTVILNETAAKAFGWHEVKDQSISIVSNNEETRYHVIGIVKDFHFNGLWRKVRPAMLRYTPEENYRYLTIAFSSTDLQGINAYLEGEWKALFPDLPFDSFFINDLQAEAVMVNESIRKISYYTAFISLLIAGMGLYALVSLNIARRTKEIGIRKVLGASVINIGQLISKEFLWLLAVASVIASGMGYFLMDMMLANIWAYHADFGIIPFIAAAAIAFVGAIFTVGAQVYRVATANPVNAIREN